MKVSEAFKLNKNKITKGEIGLEIEVEGRNLPIMGGPWRNDRDGSLRGEENIEYVLEKPLDLAGVKEALGVLNKQFKIAGTRMDETVRAGVHVHINCQELSITQLYTFMTTYIVLENLLLKFCGDYREGNLFCLRCCDAEYLLRQLAISIKHKAFMEVFNTDTLRYASMNVLALPTYGSLEFRAMRSTRDFSQIFEWINILYALKQNSLDFHSPSEVIEDTSMLGTEDFLKKCLGEHRENFDLVKNKDILIHEGMRLAQPIGYCTDWSDWEPEVEFIDIGGLKFIKDDNLFYDEPEEDF